MRRKCWSAFPGTATCPGLAQAGCRALRGLLPFSYWSSWLSCLLAHASELPGREDCRPGRPSVRACLGHPVPAPVVGYRPPPVFLLASGSTSFHHPLNTLTRVKSPCSGLALQRRAAPGRLCLFLKRGQAIERIKAKTSVALVRRAAPAFLLFGQSGRHLSMRRRQARLLLHMADLDCPGWARSGYPRRPSLFSLSSFSSDATNDRPGCIDRFDCLDRPAQTLLAPASCPGIHAVKPPRT